MGKTIIKADQNNIWLDLRELRKFKDLFLVLAYRDYRVRYAQTILGLFWAFIQPFATLMIFILIFGRAIKIDTGHVPYPLFATVGMSAWTFFSYVLNQSGSSLIASQEMIKKIYFPRLTIPLSKAVVGFVDFGITLLMIIGLMLFYRFIPPVSIIFFPLFLFLLITLSLGVGIWLSALTIRYRDFQHVIPFLVQFGLYATPVAYPSTLVPEKYIWLYNINPMVSIIEGFRWCLVGASSPHLSSWISFAAIFVIFFSGIFFFKKVESKMADLI